MIHEVHTKDPMLTNTWLQSRAEQTCSKPRDSSIAIMHALEKQCHN
jgi:hypothetical protein